MRRTFLIPVVSAAFVLLLASPGSALANGTSLVQLSTDPFTNSTSQHKTEVEPDTFASGSTISSGFQRSFRTSGRLILPPRFGLGRGRERQRLKFCGELA
jgi:hypothetical protein